MDVSAGVDGSFTPQTWTIELAGRGRILATGPGTAEFIVLGCDGTLEPCSFTLEATTPASSAVETFVRRITFEEGPFEPQP
jgi:hypothetical protein